jgi:hypothetical protein
MSINSIDSDQYVDGSIDLVHMSANSVDSDQYVDGSIDLIHMSANSVDSDQYVDGSIDTVHLADDAVTGAKLADNIDIAGTLDVTGILTADSNVVVAGNLTVNGTTTTLNTATLDVEDKNITINYGAGDTSGSANGAGITIQDAVDASNDATILWDTTNDEFDFSHAINVTGNIAVSGTVDGRDVATDGTKLDGIESSATADQTAAEIRTAVEAATDSNVFTDADHTKLNAIEALADVTDATNVTAAGALMDSELTAIASVKALNQGVATTDSPTFVNVTGTSLDISGDIDVDGTTNLDVVDIDGAVDMASTLTMSAGGTISAGGANDLVLNAGASGTPDIYLQSGGATKVKIEGSNGNVGIGTSTPLGDLSIGSNGNASGGNIQLGVDTNNANKYTAITSKAYASDAQPEGFITIASQSYDGGNDTFIGGGFGELDASTGVRFYTAASQNTATGTERLRIDESGNVGIGTSSPRTQTHILGTGQLTANITDAGSQGGTLTLSQNSTSAGSGGALLFAALNDSGNYKPQAGIKGLLGNGGGQGVGALAFSLRASTSATELTEVMRITSGGGVSVGTTSVVNSAGLTVQSNDNLGIVVGQTGTNAYRNYRHIVSTGIHTFASSNNTASLANDGAWTNASDIAYKKDIVDTVHGLETIKQLQPRDYVVKADDTSSTGFIAQEIELILPQFVIGEEGSKNVNYAQITAVLTKAIQEQQTLIESLTARITTLEG